mmetsp:Transcript_20012/g.22269  ORF Transcript_20012/g.22269 Transcript_20012/m.22269 type:complete len:473 (+) Transcript_20012:76-1494(+)
MAGVWRFRSALAQPVRVNAKLQTTTQQSLKRPQTRIFSRSYYKRTSILKNRQNFSHRLTLRHGGHHHHHHDAEVYTSYSDYLKSPGGRVTGIGLLSNVGLCIVKVCVGIVSNSHAMIADAAHSVGDMASDFVTLYTHKKANSVSDKDLLPYGAGKYESLGAFVISIMLVGTGCGIIIHAFEHIVMGEVMIPTTLALYAAGLSIVVKEALYQITYRVAKSENSPVLEANAWHHRSDALSSVVAMGGIAAAQLGVPILDPIAAIAVSGLILQTGWRIMSDSKRELIDEAPSSELLNKIKAILDNKPDVMGYTDVRARRMGSYVLVDVSIQVDKSYTVSAAHHIASKVTAALVTKIPEVSDAHVHTEPHTDDIHELHSSSLRNPSAIKQDIRNIVAKYSAFDGVDTLSCHYTNQTSVSVVLSLYINKDMSLSDARQKCFILHDDIINSVKEAQNVDIDVHMIDTSIEGKDRENKS